MEKEQKIVAQAKVTKALWERMRAVSIMQGKTTGEVLDEALTLYLDKLGFKGLNNKGE